MNKSISMHGLSLGLALLLGSAVVGCSDDDAAADTSGATATSGSAGGGSGDPQFASCSKGELEPEAATRFALQGPGVDAATGELKPGNYVVSTTYLALKPGMSAKGLEVAGPVIGSLNAMKGLVAVATGQSTSCAVLRTLTVWETEEDMFAFVGSPAHVTAMGQMGTLSRGTSNTITWESAAEGATWEEAARQLGSETGTDL